MTHTTAITEQDARTYAADWHGEQGSALYAFASSGAITPGLASEIGREISRIEESPEPYPDGSSAADDLYQLRDLLAYVESAGTFVTVPGKRPERFETGTYVSENSGQYAIGEMLRLVDSITGSHFADEIPTDDDGAELGTYGTDGPWSGLEIGSPAEVLGDVADIAEDNLNNVTEGPARWGWHEGNFGLWADADEEGDV